MSDSKQIILSALAALLIGGGVLSAQQKSEFNPIPKAVVSEGKSANKALPIKLPAGTPQYIGKSEINDPLVLPPYIQSGYAKSSHVVADVPSGGKVGNTYYDLQTNGCVQERVAYYTDGSDKYTQVLWLAATDQNRSEVHPTRGSYLGIIGVSNPAEPTDNQIGWKRMEGKDRRGGFPSLFQFTDGSVGCVSHIIGTSTSRSQLLFSKNSDFGSETYSSDLIPGTIDGLWAHTTANEQGDIHAIYSFDTTAAEYQDNNIAYIRSTDQGKTWATPVMLSGSNAVLANSPRGNGGDAYAIAARNNTVAVAYVDSIYRLVLYKSTDNGETWKAGVIFGPDVKHNLEGTDADTVVEELSGGIVRYKTAMWRAPGVSFDLIIDSKENVHIVGTVFPFFLQGTARIEGNTIVPVNDTSYMSLAVYYPYGLYHYDEENNKLNILGEVGGDEGWDANGTVYTRTFGQGMSRYPQLGIDDEDRIYCAYNSVRSNDKMQISGMQGEGLFGHIFATYYDPTLNGWARGKNITPDGFDCLFPSVCNYVADQMYIAYQADKTPGISISDQNNTLPVENNDVYLYPFPVKNLNTPVGVGENATATLDAVIQPNPAVGYAAAYVQAASNMNVTLTLHNALGMKLIEETRAVSAGNNTVILNIENLVSGAYYFTVNAGTEKITKALGVAR